MEGSYFYGARRITSQRFLQDAVQQIEQDDEIVEANIVIIPPGTGDQNIDSDEEETCEDVQGMPTDTAGELETEIYVNDHEDDTQEEQTSRLASEPRWKKTTETFHKAVNTPSKISIHSEKSCFEVFMLFFTEEMFKYLTDQTLLYAHRCQNNQAFSATVEDIRKFIGILLISGYHNVPTRNDYWSTSEDLEAPIFGKTMSRNRFREIMKYFHCADNQNLERSKVAKIRPLIEMLKCNCQQFGIFHENLSIDESMIPYTGHHSAKMFIRNKPIRFGYKMWALCGHDGFPYNFDIYCGKEVNIQNVPLGTRVVNKMLECVANASNHIVFFDNFFSSFDLFASLTDRGFRACGTIRDNRTKRCPLKSTSDMKKLARGTFDYRSDGSTVIVKWNDNSVVTIASNIYSVEPLKKVERRVRGQGRIQVTQPYLLKKYNEGMGGVDLLDRMLSSYRPKLRSKKWWWNLFSNVVNMAVVASYRFYQHINPNNSISHLEFRRQISLALVKIGTTERVRLGGPTATPLDDVRFDGINHFLTPTSQGRCVMCSANTRLHCSKCRKRLHKKCSDQYHTK